MSRIVLLAVVVASTVGFIVAAESIEITYLGHSCFTIQSEEGPVIMIDPYASYIPYPSLPQPADIVLMTHAHIDHCPICYGEDDRYTGDAIEVAAWNSQGRIREGNWRIADDLLVQFTEASHVTASGGGAGYVSLFSFEIGGIRFAHLGDLGKILTSQQIAALGDVDVLFLPVGGAFTINAAEALTVIAQLPTIRIVFPMHYFVDGITPWSEIAPLSDFTLVADALYTVIEQETDHVMVAAETLPDDTEIWILTWEE